MKHLLSRTSEACNIHQSPARICLDGDSTLDLAFILITLG